MQAEALVAVTVTFTLVFWAVLIYYVNLNHFVCMLSLTLVSCDFALMLL